MFTEKDLVFPISKPKGTMYLREVLEYENSFLKFLEGKAQPINAAYATYASRIKAGASLAEVEGLAQVVQYIESLPAAKQKSFMRTIRTELESALYNVEIIPDKTTFFYEDGSTETVDVVGELSCDSGDKNRRQKLIKVVIGKHVTSLVHNGWTGTFEGCVLLSSVTMADTVQSIEKSAFESCISLSSITIPCSVTEIGNWAFYDCTSLTSIDIPSSVTTINPWAFAFCASLTSVTIPSNVAIIGYGAFHLVPHITYHGSAIGTLWGALAIN